MLEGKHQWLCIQNGLYLADLLLQEAWELTENFVFVFPGCQASIARKNTKESASAARLWHRWVAEGTKISVIRAYLIPKASPMQTNWYNWILLMSTHCTQNANLITPISSYDQVFFLTTKCDKLLHYFVIVALVFQLHLTHHLILKQEN